MEPDINAAEPRIMHIDLNACFASIEQQANRLRRGRPVAVAAYDHPGGIIVTASYEAKARGIGVGTRVQEAKTLCPGIHIIEPDPPKYREAHRRFREVLEEFTPNVTPKSIDEFVLDMAATFTPPPTIQGPTLEKNGMEKAGYDIKRRIREHVGEAVSCNVGIGPNRFLAKLAAGLHKPDGMDRIDAHNLETVYGALRLTDLPGINRRLRTRLKLANIHTPLEFLHAPRELLRGPVFHSIAGHYWWLRLRGWEIDDQPTKQAQIGHQYAIPRHERSPPQLHAILAKLCEKTARRLREQDLTARSLRLSTTISCKDGSSNEEKYGINRFHWHRSVAAARPLYATRDILRLAACLLRQAPDGEITLLSVSVHHFAPATPEQLTFFDGERGLRHDRAIAAATDAVNTRYGKFTIRPAAMLGAEASAKDAIAFGNSATQGN